MLYRSLENCPRNIAYQTGAQVDPFTIEQRVSYSVRMNYDAILYHAYNTRRYAEIVGGLLAC